MEKETKPTEAISGVSWVEAAIMTLHLESHMHCHFPKVLASGKIDTWVYPVSHVREMALRQLLDILPKTKQEAANAAKAMDRGISVSKWISVDEFMFLKSIFPSLIEILPKDK